MPTRQTNEVYGVVYGTYAHTLDRVIQMTDRTATHSKHIDPQLASFHHAVKSAWTGHSFTSTSDIDTMLDPYSAPGPTAEAAGLEDLGRVMTTLKHYTALLLQHKRVLKRGLGKRLVEFVGKIDLFSQDTLCTEAFLAESARHV